MTSGKVTLAACAALESGAFVAGMAAISAACLVAVWPVAGSSLAEASTASTYSLAVTYCARTPHASAATLSTTSRHAAAVTGSSEEQTLHECAHAHLQTKFKMSDQFFYINNY